MERRAHHKAVSAGTAPGFRPEARRSPFGSGSSPALTRELSRSLNIRDQRLAPARVSGERHEEKDPVTRLPVPLATRAPALGAAAPSGAVSPAACGGGARTFLSEPSREIAAPASLSPVPRKGGTRVSALQSSRAGGTSPEFEAGAACRNSSVICKMESQQISSSSFKPRKKRFFLCFHTPCFRACLSHPHLNFLVCRERGPPCLSWQDGSGFVAWIGL